MVDPWVLASDVVSGVGSFVLTPLLWVVLFVWAWSRPDLARASGFGRMTFWLLFPGAALASLADAPFLPWAGNVVAINLGGALIPILLSLVLLHRELGATRWTGTGLLILFVGVEAVVQFGIVLIASPQGSDYLVPLAAGATVAIAALILPRSLTRPAALRGLTFVGLASTAIPLAFLTSQALPGVGIVSSFPYYLLPPVVAGVASAALATLVWQVPGYHGLGIGFASATFGTLIGADVLREPPLYTGAGGALLAIGGAGVLDLVYFSGLLAVGAGLLYLALASPAVIATAADTSPREPSAEEALRAAATRLEAGYPVDAVRSATTASQAAAARARLVWQVPSSTDPAAAWNGLPVAPYVPNDFGNLIAVARQPAPSPREAFRSVQMASQFVRLGRDLTRLRFAPTGRRGIAMALDLTMVTAPAVALWIFLAMTVPGSLISVLTGLAFNLAVFAYVAYAVLYLVVCDVLFGATVGKRLLGLSVTDREMARPRLLQAFLREAPKVLPLFVIGVFGAPAVLLLIRASNSSVSAFGTTIVLLTGAALLTVAVAAVGVVFAVGAVQVAFHPERQRLGDRWASTWVVDRRRVSPPWGAAASPAAPPAAAPPG
jgi:uncharacterized membrane protein/uncharacterized RDD family membrane protein YckC